MDGLHTVRLGGHVAHGPALALTLVGRGLTADPHGEDGHTSRVDVVIPTSPVSVVALGAVALGGADELGRDIAGGVGRGGRSECDGGGCPEDGAAVHALAP